VTEYIQLEKLQHAIICSSSWLLRTDTFILTN